MQNTTLSLFPEYNLGAYKSSVLLQLHKMTSQNFVSRFWAKDASLWCLENNSNAISESMGWLNIVGVMKEKIEELNKFKVNVIAAGFTDVVLMGMGGSSLAPMVLNNLLPPVIKEFNWHFLDSTDPLTIRKIESQIDLPRTLFIVASKSGTTSESIAFLEYFYHQVSCIKQEPGRNFVAITDANTPLQKLAKEKRFFEIFTNFTDIGGRYSALSYFGLVPAVLMGINMDDFMLRAQKMVSECETNADILSNPGVLLGGVLGELARLGRNKIALIMPKEFAIFGIWLEQLVAESTGKNGIGILPVITTKLGALRNYGEDTVFIHFDSSEEQTDIIKEKLIHMVKRGHPVITIPIHNIYDLGAEFYKWEIATATAASVLGVNPFDQENVQENKALTSSLLTSIEKNGGFPDDSPMLTEDTINYYSCKFSLTSNDLFLQLLDNLKLDNYIAIQAYLTEDMETNMNLESIKKLLQAKFKVTTTLGYGPRYLHSTGQYHKGGPNNGVFIQLTSNEKFDIQIPGKVYTFGELKRAQAIGDYEALLKYDRKVIRIDLGSEVSLGLLKLKTKLEEIGSTVWS